LTSLRKLGDGSTDSRAQEAPAPTLRRPRVQALAGTLPNLLFAASGITNKILRAQMTALLGTTYTVNQASYDLARLPSTA